MTKTYWLSFVSAEPPREFLGVAVVDINETDVAEVILGGLYRQFPDARPGVEALAAAAQKAYRTGCNPGGSVGALDITADAALCRVVPRNVLLDRATLDALGLLPRRRANGTNS
jgi:hypothetical protein